MSNETSLPTNVGSNDGLGPLVEGIASYQRDPEVRPRFTVQQGGRWIDDDDFIFDAALKIGGDFISPEERLRFAQWIADTLNAADARLPRVGCEPNGAMSGDQRHDKT